MRTQFRHIVKVESMRQYWECILQLEAHSTNESVILNDTQYDHLKEVVKKFEVANGLETKIVPRKPTIIMEDVEFHDALDRLYEVRKMDKLTFVLTGEKILKQLYGNRKT